MILLLMILIWMIGFGFAAGILHAMVKDGVLDMEVRGILASLLVLLVLWPHFVGYMMAKDGDE